MRFICQKCQKEYEPGKAPYRCGCGGLLAVRFISSMPDFGGQKVCAAGLWRYISSMPFEDDRFPQMVTMGEGLTPLINFDPRSDRLLAKCDYYMPTLSFKDRGAAVLIAYAKKIGVTEVVCDSSGNAGTAIAAYSARGGIKCRVFVPDSTSNKKVQQIEAYNAVVHKIPGTREDTAAAALQVVEATGAFYASHVFNPLFYEGTKTYFFEVYEQLGLKMPDAFIIPIGNGTLLLGAYRAFTQMTEWGLIDEMPKIYGVQALNCAPLYRGLKQGDTVAAAVENTGTLAEGIAIAAPARGEDILATIKASKGDIVAVSDEEILAARQEMNSLGIYVEITSAANYAGYKKLLEYHGLEFKQVVMPLCGAGVKSP